MGSDQDELKSDYMPPNLFKFATSELSQDAFIAWLICSADPKHKLGDPHRYACATAFVRALLGDEIPSADFEIAKTEVKTQVGGIDVVARINDEYTIVIEDKTGSSEHSNQLERYKNVIGASDEYSGTKKVFIYFKMEEQSYLDEVGKAGYRHFKRAEMIELLERCTAKLPFADQNDIIRDYLNHLNALETNFNSWQTVALSDWGYRSHVGFFSKLQHDNVWSKSNWAYVPNAAGGFLAYYGESANLMLDGQSTSFFSYLQSQDKTADLQKKILKPHDNILVFRIAVNDKGMREEVRGRFRQALFDHAASSKHKLLRYGRLGNTMGVARLAVDYRVEDPNGIIDYEKTVDRLKCVRNLYRDVVREFQ